MVSPNEKHTMEDSSPVAFENEQDFTASRDISMAVDNVEIRG